MSSADFTIYTPGIGTLSYSLIPFWENSAFVHFSAAIANHYNLAFPFHQVPITAGWTGAAYERLAQHLYTWPSAWLKHWLPIQVLTGLGVAYLLWSNGNWLPLSHMLPYRNIHEPVGTFNMNGITWPNGHKFTAISIFLLGFVHACMG